MRKTITSGFFDSISGDRKYNSTDMGQLFDGMIRDGVYLDIGKQFKTRPGNKGNEVIVGAGRAWFQGQWMENPTDMVLTVKASDLILDRKDAIFLVVDKTDSVRACSIEIVAGTPSKVPMVPASSISGQYSRFRIATLTIPAKSTVVGLGQIQYDVGRDPLTPYATGILNAIDPSKYVDDFVTNANFWLNNFKTNNSNDIRDWKNTQQAMIDAWVEELNTTAKKNILDLDKWVTDQKDAYALDLFNFRADITRNISEFNNYMNTSKSDWETWMSDRNDEAVVFRTQEEIKWMDWMASMSTEWSTWSQTQMREFVAWVAKFKQDANDNMELLDQWIAQQKIDYTKKLNDTDAEIKALAATMDAWTVAKQLEWTGWMNGKQTEFMTWWDVIKAELDQIDVSKIIADMNAINKRMDELYVGAKNLAHNTYDFRNIIHFSGVTSTRRIENTDIFGIETRTNYMKSIGGMGDSRKFVYGSPHIMEFNQEYTISFIVKNVGQTDIQMHCNGLIGFKTIIVPKGETKHIQFTGIRRQEYPWFQVFWSSRVIGEDIELNMTPMMMVKGSVPSDWTPAPEDQEKFVGDSVAASRTDILTMLTALETRLDNRIDNIPPPKNSLEATEMYTGNLIDLAKQGKYGVHNVKYEGTSANLATYGYPKQMKHLGTNIGNKATLMVYGGLDVYTGGTTTDKQVMMILTSKVIGTYICFVQITETGAAKTSTWTPIMSDGIMGDNYVVDVDNMLKVPGIYSVPANTAIPGITMGNTSANKVIITNSSGEGDVSSAVLTTEGIWFRNTSSTQWWQLDTLPKDVLRNQGIITTLNLFTIIRDAKDGSIVLRKSVNYANLPVGFEFKRDTAVMQVIMSGNDKHILLYDGVQVYQYFFKSGSTSLNKDNWLLLEGRVETTITDFDQLTREGMYITKKAMDNAPNLEIADRYASEVGSVKYINVYTNGSILIQEYWYVHSLGVAHKYTRKKSTNWWENWARDDGLIAQQKVTIPIGGDVVKGTPPNYVIYKKYDDGRITADGRVTLLPNTSNTATLGGVTWNKCSVSIKFPSFYQYPLNGGTGSCTADTSVPFNTAAGLLVESGVKDTIVIHGARANTTITGFLFHFEYSK